jgi:putative transposase
MGYDPDLHHRHTNRLPGYEYSLAGAYFVTLVVQGSENLFGEVVDGEMRVNLYGQCIAILWQNLPRHFPVEMDAWVVMPNHLHGIIVIQYTGDHDRRGEASGRHASPGRTNPPPDASPSRHSGGMSNSPESSSAGKDWHNPPAFPPTGMGEASGAESFLHRPESLPDASPLHQPNDHPQGTQPDSLGAILQNYKSTSTRRVNTMRGTPGLQLWQRNYYDHIIRNEKDYGDCIAYIQTNPFHWQEDRFCKHQVEGKI